MNPHTLIEKGLLPDSVIRFGIRRLLKKTLRRERRDGIESQQKAIQTWVDRLNEAPIAIETDAANEQHYEVPTDFYLKSLGPRLKYSCGLYERPDATLAEAEEAMLRLYCERMGLEDGMRVIDLGCGWGSMTLWIAEHYPNCEVTSVSNSATQRAFIEKRAAELGAADRVTVHTCDINKFETDERFDRGVSIEMFEHLRNYRSLFERISRWLKPDGALFVHIFTHGRHAYPYEIDETGKQDNWMASRFFTGGQMPSDHLLFYFPEHLTVSRHWRVDGRHYERTSNHWLENLDANRAEVERILSQDGEDGRKAARAWRVFFMACAELWGFAEGQEWFVSHYLLKPRPQTNDSWNESPKHYSTEASMA